MIRNRSGKIGIKGVTIIFAFLILLLIGSAIISAAPPNVTSWKPEETVVNNTVGNESEFEIKINQTVNVGWLINGGEVQTNESVTEASYTNKSAVEGIWNVTAIAENQNGTASQMWIWNVAPKPSILSSIISTLLKPIFPIWFLIVLLVLVVISTASFTATRTRRSAVSKEDKELKKKNKELQNDIKVYKKRINQKEDIIEKRKREIERIKKEYGEYERNKSKIKNFREKCLGEFEEIRLSGKKIKEKTIESVADVEPFREEEGEALSIALKEYEKLISLIKKAIKEKERIYKEERRKSHELVEKLEREGIDVEQFKKLLEDSNTDGLKVLHSSLDYINVRLGEKEFNPETIKRLNETREKINKMMVDWGIKIVPSKLLDFCEKLIKETSLPEEVYPNEKTVETIIDWVNEMYIK